MKNVLKIGLVLLLLLALGRGWLFRQLVSYHPVSERPAFALTDKELTKRIENQRIDISIQKIVRRSLDITATTLHFTDGKNDIDPNLLVATKAAHCVGYAAFFNTTCQALLKKAGLEKRYQVKHLRGKLSLLGHDLHQLFDTPFFRDHDYNVVKDLQTGHKLYIDASLYDVLGIKSVSAD